MKVPSGMSLSVYAELGSPQSVGITSLDKTGLKIKSDLLTQKLAPSTAIKTDPQYYKSAGAGSSASLPLYLKIDT
jgi:hypothetical protein